MRRSKLTASGTVSWLFVVVLLVLGLGPAHGSVFTIPRSELLTDAEFGAKAWGPGTLVSRAAGPGDAVDFTFTGLGGSGTGVKDDYPVDPVYGQVLPSHGNGDFSGFSGYALRFENLDDGPVWLQLCINTGFTGPSGTPSNDATNNTYWTSAPAWQRLDPGAGLLVILDFNGALAYQISDNKVPHTGGGQGWPDGNVYAINSFDRTELSAIGFEVADFSGSNPDVVLRLTPAAADAGVEAADPGGSARPEAAVRLEAYPNPGRTIGIRVICDLNSASAGGAARLAVYDVNGRLVRSLWAGWLSGGRLELSWDGTNSEGIRCRPGLYWASLSTGLGGPRALVLTLLR